MSMAAQCQRLSSGLVAASSYVLPRNGFDLIFDFAQTSRPTVAGVDVIGRVIQQRYSARLLVWMRFRRYA